jgi:hypothetical protein
LVRVRVRVRARVRVRVRVRVNLGPREHVVLVVVEADDLDARLLVAQHRPQVVLDEARLEARVPYARLPADGGLGLVLHRHRPHVDAVPLVCRDELGEVLGPRTLHPRVKAVGLGR